MHDWHPISTAPKDGTQILVAWQGRHHLAWWNDDKYARNPRPYFAMTGPWGVAEQRNNPPKIWMPLPAIPTT
jgi:hypothetical protein